MNVRHSNLSQAAASAISMKSNKNSILNGDAIFSTHIGNGIGGKGSFQDLFRQEEPLAL